MHIFLLNNKYILLTYKVDAIHQKYVKLSLKYSGIMHLQSYPWL